APEAVGGLERPFEVQAAALRPGSAGRPADGLGRGERLEPGHGPLRHRQAGAVHAHAVAGTRVARGEAAGDLEPHAAAALRRADEGPGLLDQSREHASPPSSRAAAPPSRATVRPSISRSEPTRRTPALE